MPCISSLRMCSIFQLAFQLEIFWLIAALVQSDFDVEWFDVTQCWRKRCLYWSSKGSLASQNNVGMASKGHLDLAGTGCVLKEEVLQMVSLNHWEKVIQIKLRCSSSRSFRAR